MQILRDSSLEELVCQFCERQAAKQNEKGLLASINVAGGRYEWMRKHAGSKLPRPNNTMVKIARLDRDEVGALIMREETVRDEWTRSRDLVPNPFTQVLRELAAIARSRGYFENCEANDSQLKRYREWTQRPPPQLEGVLTGSERCSIQLATSGQYEIIDGWGRLLPFETLLQKGYEFCPVEAFVCVPSDFVFGGGAETSQLAHCPRPELSVLWHPARPGPLVDNF